MRISKDGILSFELFKLEKGGRNTGLIGLGWKFMSTIKSIKKRLPKN